MVSDFFYPSIGGIQSHVYALSQCLLRRGHKVIVITHSYGSKHERQGVRYLARCLKVYYIPGGQMSSTNTIFITFIGQLPLIREILIRESIDIVHGHSCFSVMSNNAILIAKILGCATVVTEHSLYGFSNLKAVFLNKANECCYKSMDKMICVSHALKINSVTRFRLNPDHVYVVPNAVDSSMFVPDMSARDLNYITVVLVSRLVEVKGIDLLISIIPTLCLRFPELRFMIGGDGPKRLELEEVRERFQLHSRVHLLGKLDLHEVRPVLIQGDIFLNTSLVDAFCMSIVEAVSCGLYVISTCVGGIPEVLPLEFMRLVPPNGSDLIDAVTTTVSAVHKQRLASEEYANCSRTSASSKLYSIFESQIPHVQCKFSLSNELSPMQHHGDDDCGRGIDDLNNATCQSLMDHSWHLHYWIRHTYSWPQVARRTEKVYLAALKHPQISFRQRLIEINRVESVFGKLFVFSNVIIWLFLQFLNWFKPLYNYDLFPTFQLPVEDMTSNSEDDGDVDV